MSYHNSLKNKLKAKALARQPYSNSTKYHSYEDSRIKIVQYGPDHQASRDVVSRIQYLQANKLDEYFIFNIPLNAKVRSNPKQTLNVGCLSLWTINEKGEPKRSVTSFMLSSVNPSWAPVHKAAIPEKFVAAKFCVMVKNKKVPIKLEDEFFEDLGTLLKQFKLNKLSIEEVSLNRMLTEEELACCVIHQHEACKYLKHTKSHTYIMFDVGHSFTIDFIPLSNQELVFT